MSEITEHSTTTARHTTSFLRAGHDDAPLIVLVHGWPERAISWRHQIASLADLGFLVVAPDMRGYGGSTVHPEHRDYAIEEAVGDMIELLESLGRSSAVWIGHDWGSPVVWSIAGHHRDGCTAVASLCVPYQPTGFTLDALVPLVDRDRYPLDEFPAGQWEYFLFHREQFARARAQFEANVANTVKVLFRAGDPSSLGTRSPLASARNRNSWFGRHEAAPDLTMDRRVLDDESFAVHVEGLSRNGFFGADSWYVNDELNTAYAASTPDGGRLTMPVLFVHARYDLVCETLDSRLADAMRDACSDLTESTVDSGHWMAQECPAALHAVLAPWLMSLPHITSDRSRSVDGR